MKILKIPIIHTLLFLISISYSTSSIAQEWGEIGTEWIYKMRSFGPPFFHKYEITADTIIDNTNVKKIDITRYSYSGIDTFYLISESHIDQLFLTNEGDSIYWYNNHNNEFQFLYDLSPEIGDQWITHENNNFSCYNSLNPIDSQTVISSTSFTTYNNLEINRIRLRAGDSWNFGEFFYENIGPEYAFLPRPGSDCEGISEVQIQAILCYFSPSRGCIKIPTPSDNIIDLIQCSIGTSTLDIHQKSKKIQVYPIPSDNTIYISSENTALNGYLKLYDIHGKLIINEHPIYKDKINRLNLLDFNINRGIYFLQIFDYNHLLLQTEKVILSKH